MDSSSEKENNNNATTTRTASLSPRLTRSGGGSNRENISSTSRRVLPHRSTRGNLTNLKLLRERSNSSSSSGSRSSPILDNLGNIKAERTFSPAASMARLRTSSTNDGPHPPEFLAGSSASTANVDHHHVYQTSRKSTNFFKSTKISKKKVKSGRNYQKNKLSRVSESDSSEESSKFTSLPSPFSALPLSLSPISLNPSSVNDDDEDLNETKSDYPRRLMMLMLDKIPDLPPSETPDNNGDFEVERILLCQRKKKLIYFLLKWKGYRLDESSWQTKGDLKCDDVLKTFLERRNLCQKIFDDHLQNPEAYPGFFDAYKSGIVTPTFCEQIVFENGLVDFNRINGFGQTAVENWTRFTGEFPKVEFIAECLFSYAAKLELKKSETNLKTTTCECETCDPKACDCLDPSITSKGCIRSANSYSGVVIYECHKTCNCNDKCPSKKYRKGRTIPIMLFKTPNCGWSVRTMVKIKKGAFVMEYIGIIKIYDECIEIRDQTYLFDLDGPNSRDPDKQTKYVIDATEVGNESRFINHNCDPNLDVASVYGYYSDPALPRNVFFANRNIEAGEELTFCYFSHEVNPDKITENTSWCYCGAENCRKYLI